MKFFILFLALFGSLQAEPFAWSPSTTIDASLLSGDNVATCYDTLHKRVFAAWLDLDTGAPTYSIYQNNAWSTPSVIASSSTGLRCVYLCYNIATDQVFATWNETSGLDYYPAYSIFSNGAWSTASLINTNIPMVGGEVYLCYNETDHTIVATWGSDVAEPAFAVYSGSTWSVPALIPSGGTAYLNVYSCYYSVSNQVMAVWSDGGVPTYSFFNGTSWSAPSIITLTGNPINVFACYNKLTNQVFATWVDADNNDYPTYSIFNGISWSSPVAISNTPVIGFLSTLFTCYDSLHNQIFVTWPESSNCDPIYSIYSNGVWSAPAFINVSPPGVLGDIYLTYNASSDEVFATWTDCETNAPYYSIYQDLAPLLPPSQLTGVKASDKFASQTDWYVQLNWQPPVSGNPVAYQIYRDSLSCLVGVVSAISPLTFIDHNLQRKKAYTYYVISMDVNGVHSAPSSIRIK